MKRSLSLVLLTILACALCLGQTCAPTTEPPQQAGPSVIPAGNYAGQVSATVEILLNGGVQRQYSANVAFTATFDQGGVLAIPGQGPLTVGYTQTLVIGEVTLTITVDSITTTATGVDVGYSVVAVTTYNGIPYSLNGSGHIVYSVASSGAVAASLTFDASYPLFVGVTLGVHIDSNGTLTPQ